MRSNRNTGTLALMLGLGLAGAFDNRHKEFYDTRETRRVTPDGSQFHVAKQGQKVFKFNDGFECTALNQKNADKKHNKWLSRK